MSSRAAEFARRPRTALLSSNSASRSRRYAIALRRSVSCPAKSRAARVAVHTTKTVFPRCRSWKTFPLPQGLGSFAESNGQERVPLGEGLLTTDVPPATETRCTCKNLPLRPDSCAATRRGLLKHFAEFRQNLILRESPVRAYLLERPLCRSQCRSGKHPLRRPLRRELCEQESLEWRHRCTFWTCSLAKPIRERFAKCRPFEIGHGRALLPSSEWVRIRQNLSQSGANSQMLGGNNISLRITIRPALLQPQEPSS